MDTERQALEQAITAAGGPTALGEAIDVTPQAVCNWRKRGRVPPERCKAVEQVTGVPREKLNRLFAQ